MTRKENKTPRKQCCVCGRILTPFGWSYRAESDPDEVFSHGFCAECFSLELKKMRWQAQMEDAALYG